MKNLLICLLLVCSVGLITAQTVTLNNTDSSELATIYVSKPDKDISTQHVRSQIIARLQTLEHKYLSQLSKTDQRKANDLLSEIRGLLSLLPDTSGNQTNININLHNPDNDTPKPISESNLEELKKSLYYAMYDDTILKILRATAKDNYFLVSQINSILQMLSFSDDKAEAVFILYPRCIDKENKFKLLNSFTFDSDKQKVADYLEAN